MKNLTKHEIQNVAGGSSLSHVGNNIVLTIPMGDDDISFNQCIFTWTGAYQTCDSLLGQGQVWNGYQVNYSMSTSGIAQYTLTPEVTS